MQISTKSSSASLVGLLLVASIPVSFAVTTIPWTERPYDPAVVFRHFSLPVTVMEAVTILFATRSGVDLFAPLRSERWGIKAPLAALCLIALATCVTASADSLTAYIRTFAWGIHLVFGFAVAGLARRLSESETEKIWLAMLIGVIGYVLIVTIFVATLREPKKFDWDYFAIGVTNVRQLGFYSIVGFSVAIALAVLATGPRERTLALLGAAVSFGLSAWSGTRSSSLAILAMLFVTAVLLPQMRRPRAIWLSIVALLGGAALSLVHQPPVANMGLLRMFQDSIEDEHHDDASSGRWEIWSETIGRIKDRPVFGYGESQFRLIVASSRGRMNHPHNSILQVSLQWGLVGAVCFFGLMAVLFLRLMRVARVQPGIGLPAFLVASTVLIMSQVEGSLYHPYPVMAMSFAFGFGLGHSPRLRQQ